MSKTKFYHYQIWVEDADDGSKLDLNKHLDSKAFDNGPTEISGDNYQTYHIQFQHIKSNQHHGGIFRGKDEDAFIRLKNGTDFSDLSNETAGDGEAGERRTDNVDFGVVQKPKNLHVLMEVGFQTPGIGKLSQYVDNCVTYGSDYRVKHETKLGPDAEDKIQELIGTDLKKASVSFKKNPTTYSSLDVDSALDTISDDEYRLEFGVSLERGDTTPKDTETVVEEIISLFNSNNQPMTNSVRQIDFPKIMYSFNIEAVDGNKEIEHNLADQTDKEEIDKANYDFFDKKLGERLCEHIENSI